MSEETPDQAGTRALTLDQLRVLGDLRSCLEAAGYDPGDIQQLQLLLTAHLRPQAGRPVPGPEQGDQPARPEPVEALLLENLDVAALIARSSLGTPSARRIRSQTSAAQIVEILRRRDLAAATGQPPVCLAETKLTTSAPVGAFLADDRRPTAETRPRRRPRRRIRMPSVPNLRIVLAGARTKVSGRVPAPRARVKNPGRAILIAGGTAAVSTSFALSTVIGAGAVTALLGALAGVLTALLSWLITSMPGTALRLRAALSRIHPAAVIAAAIVAISALMFIPTGHQPARHQPGTSSGSQMTRWVPPSPPRPARSSSSPPRITRTFTYQQGSRVFFEISYSDPGHNATGFGFVGVQGSGLREQDYLFSNPADGIVAGNTVAYPLEQGCGTGQEYASTVRAWIYNKAGVRSAPVIIHLACRS
jgi:hypothetical protein